MQKVKMDNEGSEIIERIFYYKSDTYENFESTDEKDILTSMMKEILDGVHYAPRVESPWRFKEIISLEIHIVDHNPMKASASSHIPLPDFIMRKKAIINMENEDNKMFSLVSSSLTSSKRKTRFKNNRFERI